MSVRVAVVNDYELVVVGVRASLGPYTHRVCVVDSRATWITHPAAITPAVSGRSSKPRRQLGW